MNDDLWDRAHGLEWVPSVMLGAKHGVARIGSPVALSARFEIFISLAIFTRFKMLCESESFSRVICHSFPTTIRCLAKDSYPIARDNEPKDFHQYVLRLLLYRNKHDRFARVYSSVTAALKGRACSPVQESETATQHCATHDMPS